MTERDSDLAPVLNSLLATAKARGLTQGRLARMAHLAPETLSRMKQRGNADFSAVAALAKAVGLKLTLVPDEDRQELIRQRHLVEFEPVTYDD